MNPDVKHEYQGKAQIFKALAHPTRLFIIETINTQRLPVKELTQMVGIDISTMSKHLDVLKKAQIIEGEKEKNYIYYSLKIPCVLELMSCANKILTER